VWLRSVPRLLVTVNVVPSSPILVTLMMVEISSSETSVLARAARRNIPEDGVLNKQLRWSKLTLYLYGHRIGHILNILYSVENRIVN
jgi:phospholipid N-methyltransferase